MSASRPLLSNFPRLAAGLPIVELGEFPTPVRAMTVWDQGSGIALFAKRDDLSSPVYGGNKVRTLETLFGEARAAGATRIYSTGAYGTNHGLAAILHAKRAGFESGVILFPQPHSECALVNLRAVLSERPIVRDLPHWSALPFGMIASSRADLSAGVRATQMVPGGATATGGLGYVNAGLELATQVERGELPAPAYVVLGAGSNCTSAGLLVGFRLAARLGIGFREPPIVRAVRVTPWPVTSALRIVSLATEIAAALAHRTGDASLAFTSRELGAKLELDGRRIGWGYGIPTARGRALVERFRDDHGWELDTTYSSKAMAGALDAARESRGPVVYWSTKSTAALPPGLPRDELFEMAPPRMRRWMLRAERVLAGRRSRGLVPP